MFDRRIQKMMSDMLALQSAVSLSYTKANDAGRIIAEKGFTHLTEPEQRKVFESLADIAALLEPYRQ